MYDGRGQFAREKRVPDKEAVVVISVMLWNSVMLWHSVMLGNTFKHSHFGGRYFFYLWIDSYGE